MIDCKMNHFFGEYSLVDDAFGRSSLTFCYFRITQESVQNLEYCSSNCIGMKSVNSFVSVIFEYYQLHIFPLLLLHTLFTHKKYIYISTYIHTKFRQEFPRIYIYICTLSKLYRIRYFLKVEDTCEKVRA